MIPGFLWVNYKSQQIQLIIVNLQLIIAQLQLFVFVILSILKMNPFIFAEQIK